MIGLKRDQQTEPGIKKRYAMGIDQTAIQTQSFQIQQNNENDRLLLYNSDRFVIVWCVVTEELLDLWERTMLRRGWERSMLLHNGLRLPR